MNKKAQLTAIIAIISEFVIIFFILLAAGPVVQEAAKNMPFWFKIIINLIFPGPEDSVFNFIKAFIESGMISGVTGFFVAKNS